MYDIRVRVYQNPWEHSVPNARLIEIVEHVAETRATHVEKHHESGHYSRPSLALSILNPEAELWRPSSETLLATIAIGIEGERFVENAIAKAVQHRDHGFPAGYGVYVDLTQSGDGDFCYGYSTKVDNTYGGVSAQTELQDACEAGHALVTFNYLVRLERTEWRMAHPDARWFCNEDKPRTLYTEMANQAAAIYDSAKA